MCLVRYFFGMGLNNETSKCQGRGMVKCLHYVNEGLISPLDESDIYVNSTPLGPMNYACDANGVILS